MATKYLAKGKQEIFQNCPKGDPALPVPYDSRFFNTTHTSLNVVNKPDPIDTTGLCVKVVNGSTGKGTSLNLKSTDTIGKLKQMFLEKRPGMVESLNLVFHGKPVEDSQCLGVLGVKAGATFITFQKCHGG